MLFVPTEQAVKCRRGVVSVVHANAASQGAGGSYPRRVQSAATPMTAIPKPRTSDMCRACPLPPKERIKRSHCVPSTASSRQPRSTSNVPRYRSIVSRTLSATGQARPRRKQAVRVSEENGSGRRDGGAHRPAENLGGSTTRALGRTFEEADAEE